MNKFCYITLFFTLSATASYSQTYEKERFVQVSGIITDEFYRPVSGVVVVSRKLHRGSVSERTGIYSITSTPGDTIFFRALGFKRYHTIIPPDFEERHCEVDIALEVDTIAIEEVTILPWKSYNEFIKDMTKEHPVDPIIENMNDNIASIYVAIANQTNAKISGASGFKYAMEQNFSAMSTKNQYPVNNLLNPFAWAKFIKGVKNGLFKNQKFNKPVNAKVRKKIKKK
ncbi:MAG: carboxypeptidase regulatory-like domain-containing protein [Bacteroidetes bacterium]|nr:MAG: carboxypeptidase regulatory-like domain-containing protein [Bacteroidota bacterium]